MGVGTVSGVDYATTLENSVYHALCSGPDAVRYVSIGNSTLGRNARSVKVRNLCVMPLPLRRRRRRGNETLTGPSPHHPSHPNIGTTEIGASMWIEYQTQCNKANKRVEKFGTEYRQPPPDTFFKRSTVEIDGAEAMGRGVNGHCIVVEV